MTQLDNGSLSNPYAIAMFDQMRAVIEAPGFTALKAFKDDFYEIDRHILQSTWSPSASYLWVVRENGTHLALVGATDKDYEELKAAVELCRESQIFLVSASGIESIDQVRFNALIAEPAVYAVRCGSFYRNKAVFATYTARSVRKECGDYAVLDIQSAAAPMSLADIQAVRRIATKHRTCDLGSRHAFIATIDGIGFERALAEATEKVISLLQSEIGRGPATRMKP